MDRTAATTGLDMVATAPAWCIARGERVFVVVLDGVIDDVASTAWQKAAGDDLRARGYPRFGFVLSVSGTSDTTLSNRMKTAAFTRAAAAAMQKVVIVANTHQSFVIHSIMRVAGIANVRFIGPSEGPAVLAALVVGTDPF